MTFSLILPCYNEARSLEALVRRAVACAAGRRLAPHEFRLILVDNGSTDDTARVLEEVARGPGGEYVDIVTVPVNQGYGHGVASGLRAARPGAVGWTHADEQCDPEDAFRAWELWRTSPDATLVKGARHGRAPGHWLFSRCFELAASCLLGRRFHEINAQPKVFPVALLDALESPPRDFTFDLYVMLKAAERGYRVREIPVRFPPRPHGESRWAATFRSKARTVAGFLRFMIRYRLSA